MFILVSSIKKDSEFFISTSDRRLIDMKKNIQAKAPQNTHWNNVKHITKVRSILSDWSAFTFDFGDDHGQIKSFQLSEIGKTLVIRFT